MAFFSYLTVQPSYRQKVIYDNYLFKPLIAAGIFTELDRLWVPAAELEQHGTISLVNPASTALTLVNTPTWTQYQGWTPNGTTSYENTQFTPTVNGVKYIQNSASEFIYLRTNTTGSSASFGVDLGVNANSSISYLQVRTNTGLFTKINQAAAAAPINVANADSRGFWLTKRTASNAFSVYKNGGSIGSGTSVSNALANAPFFAGAYNSGGATFFSNREHSVIGAGGIFNEATFYNIIQGYMTAIGTQV